MKLETDSFFFTSGKTQKKEGRAEVLGWSLQIMEEGCVFCCFYRLLHPLVYLLLQPQLLSSQTLWVPGPQTDCSGDHPPEGEREQDWKLNHGVDSHEGCQDGSGHLFGPIPGAHVAEGEKVCP